MTEPIKLFPDKTLEELEAALLDMMDDDELSDLVAAYSLLRRGQRLIKQGKALIQYVERRRALRR